MNGFLKYNTIEEAEQSRTAQNEALKDAVPQRGVVIICPPIATWDGMWAVPKEVEAELGGTWAESIDPPVVEREP